MSKQNYDTINELFHDLTYEERIGIFTKNFSTGSFSSGKLDNKLALIIQLMLSDVTNIVVHFNLEKLFLTSYKKIEK